MADIIIIGLLLTIILILITVLAPEVLIYGVAAFCVIFLAIAAIFGITLFVNDPIGSLLGMVDNNPIMGLVALQNTMLNSMSPAIQVAPFDPKEWRIFSIITFAIGIGVISWMSYNIFFKSSKRRKCAE